MQCKVLKFSGSDRENPAKMESEINRWLAQGWTIASTSYVHSVPSSTLVFLTK